MKRLAFLATPAILLAQAPAPSLSQQLRTESPAVDALAKEFKYKEALAKVEGMIPAAKPDFVKGDPRKGLESSQEYSSLMAMHALGGKMALLAGDWAKAKDHFVKAQTVATENHTNFKEVAAPLIQTWQKAMEDSTKSLEENAARRKDAEAKAEKDRTPQDQDVLKAVAVWENNVKNGGKVIKQLEDHADGLRKDTEAFAKPIEGIDKDLKVEADLLASDKFKGDKSKYVTAVLNTPKNFELPSQTDKVKLLYRLLYLDPANTRAIKSLEAAKLGQEVPVPEEKKAPAAKAPAKKAAKKQPGK
jgi:phosphopantetheinyl transferase (holo-ACP synthase)